MGGAIQVRGFEWENDLTGRGAAQPFVAEGLACDVATHMATLMEVSMPISRMLKKHPLSIADGVAISVSEFCRHHILRVRTEYQKFCGLAGRDFLNVP